MNETQHPLLELLERDPRYKFEAYQFVRDALAYAQEELKMGAAEVKSGSVKRTRPERHLTGQELCEAIRQLALDQFGFMAKTVLNSWGLHCTGDFGDIVYNLIDIKLMKKSPQDQREHFDDVYDFDTAFREEFQITLPEGS